VRDGPQRFVGQGADHRLAAGEAAVTRTLLIAGDQDHPVGPFASTMGLLRTDLFPARGITSVGFAGHPEGHVAVSERALEQALEEKLAFAANAGLESFIVTQFCFTADPVIAWLRMIARIAPDVPVRIGVAGPATAATLIRFAIRCGIGNSMRAIQTRTNMIGRLLSETGPQEVLRGLSVVLAEMSESQVAGAHFYPFGGVDKTSDWISETLTRLYAQITAKAD
jgi:methylenetetrahydrofolate reductase (NADPH)